jgi:hypothetical protein
MKFQTLLFIIALLFISPYSAGGEMALVPRTGQTASYAVGDDGNLQIGVSWPIYRFTDNNNGTITDNLTGLIWLKNANCTDTVGGINKSAGNLVWGDALTWSNNLSSGLCGLSDGSNARDWRLPNIVELESLIDQSQFNPALVAGHPFYNLQTDYYYWTSNSSSLGPRYAWVLYIVDGYVGFDIKYNLNFVWPVRSIK